MLTQNTRTKTRQDFNGEYLDSLRDHDLHYVYGLVNMETGEVGYVGTTYSPRQRAQHHAHDLRWFKEGRYNRQSLAKVTWMAKQPDPPEMKIFAVCPTRRDAEYIERGLIHQFETEGNYHYWKYRPENDSEQLGLFDASSTGDEKPF